MSGFSEVAQSVTMSSAGVKVQFKGNVSLFESEGIGESAAVVALVILSLGYEGGGRLFCDSDVCCQPG